MSGNLGEDILIHIWEYIPFFVIANGITFAKISRVAYERFHRPYANLLAVFRETAESEFPYRLDVNPIDILRQLSKISLACNRTSRYACLLLPGRNALLRMVYAICHSLCNARQPYNYVSKCYDLFKELLHYTAVECIQDNFGDLEMSVEAYVKDCRHLFGVYMKLHR